MPSLDGRVIRIACVRFAAPSFCMMPWICVFTVLSDMPSSKAMALFDLPHHSPGEDIKLPAREFDRQARARGARLGCRVGPLRQHVPWPGHPAGADEADNLRGVEHRLPRAPTRIASMIASTSSMSDSSTNGSRGASRVISDSCAALLASPTRAVCVCRIKLESPRRSFQRCQLRHR
jgi:hypothetical protein